nr:MAG TPA: hypothetical protein [Caudoviricetes sp.]
MTSMTRGVIKLVIVEDCISEKLNLVADYF